MNVKLLLTLVGLIDLFAFVGLCFWDGRPFTYLIIVSVTAGLGFTGGVFESIVPSKISFFFKFRLDNFNLSHLRSIVR